MARNGSGVYAPPSGTSPLLPSTLADATKLETRLTDMGSEITGSLPRNGSAGMSAPLILSAGSAAAPGLTFSGDADSGLALVGGRICVVKDGVVLASCDSDDFTFPLPVTFSDAVTFNGALTASSTVGAGLVPPGAMMHFGGASAPSGWLFCYGQAISRTTYAALYAALGGASSPHGQGDGVTTFNLPDCRGRTLAGLDNMGGTSANRLTGLSGGVDGDVLGAAGGAETHTLTEAQLAAHTHTVPTTAVIPRDGWGNSGSNFGTSTFGRLVVGTGGFEGGEILESIKHASGDQSVTLTGSGASGSSGSGSAHNNVQPTLVLPVIIKT